MVIRWLAQAVAPRTCPLCGGEGADGLCGRCRADLTPLAPPCCRRCGSPLPPSAPRSPLCGACRRRGRPVIRSGFAYRGVLRELLLRWKFGPDRYARPALADLLVDGLVRWYPDYSPDLVIPVPPTEASLRKRLFCPALDLALGAARFLGAPCLRDGFIHRGVRQVGLDRRARERGMRGAILPRGPLPGGARRILVVDDVVTTGATLREMVRALRAEVRNPDIRCITLCRTLSGAAGPAGLDRP